MTTKGKIGIIAALVICIGLYAWMMRPPGAPGKVKPPPVLHLTHNLGLLKDNWPNLIANAAGPALGNPNAPWTVIEFGDFQCPQCGKAHAFVERMVTKSNGQVKVYFVNFPLPKAHAFATSAALAGLAASNQGKFWDMYEAMYSNQDRLNASGIGELAGSIKGMDMTRFRADWHSAATASALANEAALDNKVQIQITPTFVLRSTKGGEITRFVGNFGQRTDPVIPGLIDLMQSNPWHVQYAPEDMPDLSREQ